VWDVEHKTAVAQAELEDREIEGAYHRIAFHRADGGGDLFIDTTRPELIPACVALVAHPSDERYKPLFSTSAITPLFGASVPILPHPLADPEKGTGLVMVCTFGDMTDVTWWRELQLPVRAVMGRDGTLAAVEWGTPGWESRDADAAQRAYDEVAGKGAKQAARRMVELLRESGEIEGDARPITHPVKFWENGTRPLEIITNRQWFIRNGGRDEDIREAMLAYGRELRWHPDYMRVRYENWVNGLAGDWNISRQLPFGVPIPLWYPVGDDGEIDWDAPIKPTVEELPIDPSTHVPAGYDQSQRGKPGGFAGDPNVMDTWATSSLSPQIIGGWPDDEDLFSRVFPYDLRPQAHDIIRTWLFYTILRSHFEHGQVPWANAAISGFIHDPERKKLSKSAGNASDNPMNLLSEFGADSIRYWAAGGRPGMDTALDRNQFKIGRRLAIKVLNASRFVLQFGEPPPEATATEPLDLSLLTTLRGVVASSTAAFEDYDYTRALETTESFFWDFCNDYVELVKQRAYAGDASALATLRLALSTVLRLLAPFLSYATEEVWSWWQDGSIHRAGWPAIEELPTDGDPLVFDAVAEVLRRVRRSKTEAKVSMKAAIARTVVQADALRLAAVRAAEKDLREAGGIAELALAPAPDGNLTVTVDLLTEPV
jgi:valyl-tRNA synthetase